MNTYARSITSWCRGPRLAKIATSTLIIVVVMVMFKNMINVSSPVSRFMCLATSTWLTELKTSAHYHGSRYYHGAVLYYFLLNETNDL